MLSCILDLASLHLDLKAVAYTLVGPSALPNRITQLKGMVESTSHSLYCERPPKIHPNHCPANVPGRKNVRYATSSPADNPPTSAENTMYVRKRATGDRLRSAPPGIEEFLKKHVECQGSGQVS